MSDETLLTNEKPPKKRLVSTIIMGSFLLIMLAITIILLPLDLKAAMDSLKESTADGDAGTAIGSIFAALFIALGVFMFHLAFIVFIIAGGVMLIFIIKNIKKAYLKQIRIANWVLFGVDILIMLVSIVKIVLLFVEK